MNKNSFFTINWRKIKERFKAKSPFENDCFVLSRLFDSEIELKEKELLKDLKKNDYLIKNELENEIYQNKNKLKRRKIVSEQKKRILKHSDSYKDFFDHTKMFDFSDKNRINYDSPLISKEKLSRIYTSRKNPSVIPLKMFLQENNDNYIENLVEIKSNLYNSVFPISKISESTIPLKNRPENESFHWSKHGILRKLPTRNDVKSLDLWLNKMIKNVENIKNLDNNQAYDIFQLIYSGCLKELIRQISMECTERAQLLHKIFNSYITIFENIRISNERKNFENDKENINEINRIHKIYQMQINKLEEEFKNIKEENLGLEEFAFDIKTEGKLIRKQSKLMNKNLKIFKKELENKEALRKNLVNQIENDKIILEQKEKEINVLTEFYEQHKIQKIFKEARTQTDNYKRFVEKGINTNIKETNDFSCQENLIFEYYERKSTKIASNSPLKKFEKYESQQKRKESTFSSSILQENSQIYPKRYSEYYRNEDFYEKSSRKQSYQQDINNINNINNLQPQKNQINYEKSIINNEINENKEKNEQSIKSNRKRAVTYDVDRNSFELENRTEKSKTIYKKNPDFQKNDINSNDGFYGLKDDFQINFNQEKNEIIDKNTKNKIKTSFSIEKNSIREKRKTINFSSENKNNNSTIKNATDSGFYRANSEKISINQEINKNNMKKFRKSEITPIKTDLQRYSNQNNQEKNLSKSNSFLENLLITNKIDSQQNPININPQNTSFLQEKTSLSPKKHAIFNENLNDYENNKNNIIFKRDINSASDLDKERPKGILKNIGQQLNNEYSQFKKNTAEKKKLKNTQKILQKLGFNNISSNNFKNIEKFIPKKNNFNTKLSKFAEILLKSLKEELFMNKNDKNPDFSQENNKSLTYRHSDTDFFKKNHLEIFKKSEEIEIKSINDLRLSPLLKEKIPQIKKEEIIEKKETYTSGHYQLAIELNNKFIDKLKNLKGNNNLKAYFSKNSLLKIISGIYCDKIKSYKEKNTPLIEIFYDYLLFSYGMKKMAELKYLQIIETCYVFSHIKKINNFLRFLKIIDNYEEKQFELYIEFMKRMDEIFYNGLSIAQNTNEKTLISPEICLKVFENYFNEKQINKDFFKNEKIEFDEFILIVFDHSNSSKDEKQLKEIFDCFSDEMTWNNFIFLFKLIESEKIIENLFIKKEFLNYCDIINPNKGYKTISFQNFNNFCKKKNIFTRNKIEEFLNENLIGYFININDLKLKWRKKRKNIKYQLIEQKLFTKIIEFRFKKLNKFIKINESDSLIWFFYKCFEKEVFLEKIKILTEIFLPQNILEIRKITEKKFLN